MTETVKTKKKDLKGPPFAVTLPEDIWPPVDRPVTGRDLESFRQRMGLTLTAIDALFGIPSRKAWYEITSPKADSKGNPSRIDEPVQVSIAILLRFLSRYPDLIPLRMKSSINDLRERMELSPTAFGILSGRHDTTVRLWMDNRAPHPIVLNLMSFVERALDKMSGAAEPDPARMLAELYNCALIEWSARGESPGTRESAEKLHESHPNVIELILSLNPESRPVALGGPVTKRMQGLLDEALTARNVQLVNGSLNPAKRKKATEGVRRKRMARKALSGMVSAVSLED